MGGDGRNAGRGLLWRTKCREGQVESFVDGRWVVPIARAGARCLGTGP